MHVVLYINVCRFDWCLLSLISLHYFTSYMIQKFDGDFVVFFGQIAIALLFFF